jgi:hypothetical protein
VTNSDGQSGTKVGAFYYDVPPPPTSLSPNGTTLPSTTTSVTLSWGATYGSSRYAVRVQDNTNGTLRDPRNNCPTNTVYLCVDGVSGTTYSVPVQAGHSYTWWVHAGSSCGQYSAQTTASFSVAFPAPTVTSISPGNGPLIGGTAVTITGTGFRSGATVSIGGTGATSVVVVSASQITARTPAHACGSNNVVVTNSDGQSGTKVGAFYYDVPPPPATLSPNGTVFPGSTTSVTLSWGATYGSSRYAVRVQDNTNGTLRDSRNNCPTNTVYLCVDGVSGTTYSVPVQAGHSYTWWVHAGSSCGQYSTQTTGSFSVAAPVPPSAPSGLSPNATTLPSGTTTVTMRWSPTSGATKYAVRLRDDTNGTLRSTWACPGSPTIYLCVNDIAPTSYSATVVPGHSYTWWVHAGNDAGYSPPTYATFSTQ